MWFYVILAVGGILSIIFAYALGHGMEKTIKEANNIYK